jgi:CBS domain-containing protein
MKVGDICTRNPATVSTSATLAEVARLMTDRHIGAVIVTKAPLDRPIASGIITDSDIACAQLDRASEERGVRRAPVVSSTGALVGVVSTDDLLAHVARELMYLARLVTLQPRQEAARAGGA